MSVARKRIRNLHFAVMDKVLGDVCIVLILSRESRGRLIDSGSFGMRRASWLVPRASVYCCLC